MTVGAASSHKVGAAPNPDAVVVATYLPGETPFTSNLWRVLPVECVSVFDYARGLATVWGSDLTVVNVEHDIEVTDDIIARLVDCPEPLCAQTYPLYRASGAHGTEIGPVFPYVDVEPGPWVTEGAEWADWAAPGFIKATAAARTGLFPDEKHWMGVEQATNFYVTGRWHLHWPPVEHYHQ